MPFGIFLQLLLLGLPIGLLMLSAFAVVELAAALAVMTMTKQTVGLLFHEVLVEVCLVVEALVYLEVDLLEVLMVFFCWRVEHFRRECATSNFYLRVQIFQATQDKHQ